MKKKIFIFVGILVFVCLSVGVFVLKIKYVYCVSDDTNCDGEIQNQVDGAIGKNIFVAGKYIEDVLSKNDRVDDFNVNVIILDGLKVDIVEKDAIVAFIKPDNNLAYVTENGDIMDIGDSKLPKVKTYYTLDKDQLGYVSRLVKVLYDFYKPQEFLVYEDKIEVNYVEGKKILLPLDGDPELVLGGLSVILSRLPRIQEASTIKTIDLRYKNPVLL